MPTRLAGPVVPAGPVPTAVFPSPPMGALPLQVRGPSIGGGLPPQGQTGTGGAASLGWSLAPRGELDFDPVANFFQDASEATSGMRQRVSNKNGVFEERNFQIRTNNQGQVIEHFADVQTGDRAKQGAAQRQMRYANAQSGVVRQAQERTLGEKAVRQIVECNKITGEDRQTELVRGLPQGNQGVNEFNALWAAQAGQVGAATEALLALPPGLQFVPLPNGESMLRPLPVGRHGLSSPAQAAPASLALPAPAAQPALPALPAPARPQQFAALPASAQPGRPVTALQSSSALVPLAAPAVSARA